MDPKRLTEKPFHLTDDELEWVASTLAGLSTKEKVAQLFLVLGVDETMGMVESQAKDDAIGGVLIRPWPLDRISEAHRHLDEIAKVPLLKAANLEEGGSGVLTDGTYFGTPMEVSATHDESCVRAYAEDCALEGRKAGVNWAFAPIVDLDLNPLNPITNIRTFGSDPEWVLECGRIYMETVQRYGIAAALKHFPGDGMDYRDQHLHPTYNTMDAEDWFDTTGRIYETLIDDGALSVMAAHIIAPEVIKAVNPDAGPEDMLPASQSREMLTGILRERFGFNGVIISDASVMGGFTMTMPRAKALPLAIERGCDMFCFTADTYQDMRFVMQGLDDGLLSMDRLDEAVMRLLALKAVLAREYPMPEIDVAAERARCADEAITLVKDKDDLLPITPVRFPHVKLVTFGKDECHDGSVRELVTSALEEQGFDVTAYDPSKDFMHGPGQHIEDGTLTLMVASMPTFSHQTTVRLQWSENLAMDMPRFIHEEPTVFVSLANPYHLQDVPLVRTYVNAYAPSKDTIDATVRKLVGLSPFEGVSPVDAFAGLPDTRL